MSIRVLQPFFDLAARMREHAFAVSPDQTMGFIEAVGVLGPRNIGDIRRAAIALFAIPPERLEEFDAIFQALFYGNVISAEAKGSDDSVDAHEDTGQVQSQEVRDDSQPTGTEAISAEQLNSRAFQQQIPERVLAEFERDAKAALPRRQSYRWHTNLRGKKPDLRQSLKAAARYEGEVVELKFLRRKKKQRKVLLLIDVSGSMKERSEASLRFAHSLVRVVDQCEVFTLGTRLTRVTRVLAVDEIDMALARVSELVADFDGGTRIGSTLQAYLAIPRYAGFARGAAVVVHSDGLERGDPTDMFEAVQKISRLAWRLSWLTPLAGNDQYQLETEALRKILPLVDQFGSSHSIESMCDHVMQLARNDRPAFNQASFKRAFSA